MPVTMDPRFHGKVRCCMPLTSARWATPRQCSKRLCAAEGKTKYLQHEDETQSLRGTFEGDIRPLMLQGSRCM